jgi:hypothetical protein
VVAFLCIAFSAAWQGAFAASTAVYLRSNTSAPWGSTANETAMDRVFGAGNWQDLRYETVNPTAVFSGATSFVYMEGSDATALELQTFLTANLSLIESWVAGGGRLFLNAAPNEGTGMYFGFGVNLFYPGDATGTAGAFNTLHPIFTGPFAPVGTVWTGSSFAHATITGTNITTIITNASNGHIVLGEKQFGNGLVLLGGMTTDNFHSPQPQASNLRANIISYTATFVSCSNCPPQIIGQPVSRTTAVGGTVTFDVAASGTSPLFYQWRQDGTNILSATNTSYTIVNAQSNQIGSYTVVVTNNFGKDTSTEATLTLLPPDAFIAVFDDPAFVDTGGTPDSESDAVQATLDAVGFPTITFTNIPDAANTYRVIEIPEQERGWIAFGLPAATSAALSNFVSSGGKLIIHGSSGGGAALLLNTVFGFSLQEIDSSGLSHTLSIETTGTDFANDPPIIFDNPTTTLLVRSSLPSGAFNVYTNASGSSVVVFEQGGGLIIFLGWDWSNAKPLGVVNGGWLDVMQSAAAQGALPPRPPGISSQPLSRTAFIGSTPTFSVSVFGTAPFSFQWRKGTNGILGATNSTYSIPNVQLSNAGSYSVLITNLYGSATSSPATLTVTNDFGFSDDFDPGIDLLQWASFSSTVLATNYGGSVSGPNSLWLGGDDVSRMAVSRVLDTHAGGVVDFFLRLGSGSSAFWEQVDLPDEGVVLEYSIDGGSTWIQLGRYDTAAYTDWTHIQEELPPDALTFATQIRWRQLSNSGACCDHWALDNVSVQTGPRPPVVLGQPASRATIAGNSVTFSVRVGGSAPLTYQWRKNETNIPNATNISFTIPGVQDSDAGAYRLFVTNLYGMTLSSNAALTILASNAFVGVFDDPAYVDTGGGNSAESDTVQASIQSFGYPVLPFTNLIDGVNSFHQIVIPEQEIASLMPGLPIGTRAALSNFVFNGGKLVIHGTASGSAGTLINGIFGLSILEFDAGGLTLLRSADANGTDFATDALSLPPLSATTVLTRNSLPPGTLNLYTNNSGTGVALIPRGLGTVFFIGWDWFDAAPIGSQDQGWLGVLETALNPQLNCTNCPPRFTLQPTNQNVLPGTNVTLVASAIGTGGAIRYQWRFEGSNILNATNAFYSFTNASLANHGRHSVVATDANGDTESTNALINVLVRPGIAMQLQPQTVLEGQTAIFTVVATGAPPLYYRWIRGGFPYLTSSVPMLVLTNNLSNTTVRVAITNLASGVGGLNSLTVSLTVLADFDRDGMADAWEVQYGLNTNNAADALFDLDGDGMINRDEYLAGTNPNDPSSLLRLAVNRTNSAILEFVALPNTTYTVQYQTNLTAGVWSNLVNVATQAQVRTIQINATNGLPPFRQRFYRVVAPRSP